MPAAVALRVRNPKDLEQLECFPAVAFSWGGYLAMTGFPRGSNYLGNEVQPPVRDALAYLKERHLPRTRANIQVRLVGEEVLPGLAEAGMSRGRDTGHPASSAQRTPIRYQGDRNFVVPEPQSWQVVGSRI